MVLVVGYRIFTIDHLTRIDFILLASAQLIFLIYYIPYLLKSWKKNKIKDPNKND
jgi:hypothetical protein